MFPGGEGCPENTRFQDNDGPHKGKRSPFGPRSTPTACPRESPCYNCPCHKGGKTVAKERKAEPEEECDVMRKMLGMKKRKGAGGKSICHQMIGWTNDPKRIAWAKKENLPNWPSKEFGMPGVIVYTYIKHRKECPKSREAIGGRIDELTPREKRR